jgi:3-dehydroquinate dehydratase
MKYNTELIDQMAQQMTEMFKIAVMAQQVLQRLRKLRQICAKRCGKQVVKLWVYS